MQVYRVFIVINFRAIISERPKSLLILDKYNTYKDREIKVSKPCTFDSEHSTF
jgi:hypothetical protein